MSPDQTNEHTYGLIFHPSFPIEWLPEYARKAEKAGFEELWLWDDCFLPGAISAAAIALSATQRIKVCIGLLPVPVYNPLFAAMEITTLAASFPGRFIAGFGHGVGPWMKQIGAADGASLARLRETVSVVRELLGGKEVTFNGETVHLDRVQMHQLPAVQPPLYVGAMREKSLALAGNIGDGTILTGMSSPQYIEWAMQHIRSGMQAAGRSQHRVVSFLDVKVDPDGEVARAAARKSLADRLPWADVHLAKSGLSAEVSVYLATHAPADLALHMPDAWLDAFSASGTPAQVAATLQRWFKAGVNTLILQPLGGDPACLDEYVRYLMPILRSGDRK